MGLPRALLFTYLLKILHSFSYFSLSLNIVLFLSDEHGFSDSEAGWAYGLVGFLVAVYGLATGYLVDGVGVRTSFLAGAAIAMTGRLMLACTRSVLLLRPGLFVLVPLGEALGVPVLTIAVRRCTDAHHEMSPSQAYSYFYAAMNVAVLASGWATDLARWASPGWAARGMLVAGSLCNAVAFAVAWWQLQDAAQLDEELAHKTVLGRGEEKLKPVLCQKTFWRLAMCGCGMF